MVRLDIAQRLEHVGEFDRCDEDSLQVLAGSFKAVIPATLHKSAGTRLHRGASRNRVR